MKYYLLILTLIFICSCNNTSAPNTTEQVIEIPEAFVSFYEKFHSDSIYQLNHIVFPLKKKSDLSRWLKSEWKLHRPFDDQNGSYLREFDNFNGIIIETIREKNNMFLIQRRFAPSEDSYNLIYYTLDNKLEMWGVRTED